MTDNTNEKSSAQIALTKAFDNLYNASAYKDPIKAYMADMAAINASGDENPVTSEQWEQLYEVAKTIRLLEPWKHLHESECITLLLPGRDEPVYIVTMGSGDMTYGIGIYPGYNSYYRMMKMTENEVDEDDMSVAFEQHCINLYFGDRDELETRDKNVIKQLSLKFRGRNEWPYFRSMKPGFMPWFINRDEAELTIAALQNFTMACLAYVKNGFEVDFENGETVLRFYDSDTDMWYNTVVKMPLAPFILPKIKITDDVLISNLKKKRKSKANLGFAITYIPVPIQENKNQRPKMPRMAVLMDMDKGGIIDRTTDAEHGVIGVAITELLTRYVEKHGRPASIAVPDEDTGDYIDDFANKLGIKMTENERLSSFGKIALNIMGAMGSGQLDNFMGF